MAGSRSGTENVQNEPRMSSTWKQGSYQILLGSYQNDTKYGTVKHPKKNLLQLLKTHGMDKIHKFMMIRKRERKLIN